MARILENKKGRRLILLSANDVISIVGEYVRISRSNKYSYIRNNPEISKIFIPEDL